MDVGITPGALEEYVVKLEAEMVRLRQQLAQANMLIEYAKFRLERHSDADAKFFCHLAYVWLRGHFLGQAAEVGKRLEPHIRRVQVEGSDGC